MARTVKATSVPTDQCPEGVYGAIVNEIKDWTPQADSQYGTDPQFLWVFLIKRVIHANPVRPTKANPEPMQPADWLDKELWGFSSTLMTPKAKLRGWIESIEGRELDDDEEYDLDSLIGRKVTITVGRSNTGKHKVIQVTAYGNPAQTAMPSATPEPEPEAVSVAAGAPDFDDEDDPF